MIRWLQYKYIAHICQKQRKSINMSNPLVENYLPKRGRTIVTALFSMVLPAKTKFLTFIIKFECVHVYLIQWAIDYVYFFTPMSAKTKTKTKNKKQKKSNKLLIKLVKQYGVYMFKRISKNQFVNLDTLYIFVVNLLYNY